MKPYLLLILITTGLWNFGYATTLTSNTHAHEITKTESQAKASHQFKNKVKQKFAQIKFNIDKVKQKALRFWKKIKTAIAEDMMRYSTLLGVGGIFLSVLTWGVQIPALSYIALPVLLGGVLLYFVYKKDADKESPWFIAAKFLSWFIIIVSIIPVVIVLGFAFIFLMYLLSDQ